VLAKGLAYAARRVGEISDDVAAIDDAMRWGYNWELGPFETWDALGFAPRYDRMVADGVALPESVTGDARRRAWSASTARTARSTTSRRALRVARHRRRKRCPTRWRARARRCGRTTAATLYDLGDGIASLTLKSKMNSIDPR
jgi:3-hydroxyacyl-CoA dehydrogenase